MGHYKMTRHKMIFCPTMEGQIMQELSTSNMVVLSGRRIFRPQENDYLCELMNNSWVKSGSLKFTRGIKWIIFIT